MNLADLFLQELAKDSAAGPGVRHLGKMLAAEYKTTQRITGTSVFSGYESIDLDAETREWIARNGYEE